MIKNSRSQIVICSVPFFGEIMEGLVRPRTYLDQGHLMSRGHVTSAVMTGPQAQRRILCLGLTLCSHHLETVNFDFVKKFIWESEASTKDLESWLNRYGLFYTISLSSCLPETDSCPSTPSMLSCFFKQEVSHFHFFMLEFVYILTLILLKYNSFTMLY